MTQSLNNSSLQHAFSQSPLSGLVSNDLLGLLFERIRICTNCIAPTQAFVDLFAAEGVPLTIAQARDPMGLPKWRHIAALSKLAHVQASWLELHDRVMNTAAIPFHSALIAGVSELVARTRKAGLNIGSTTDYTRVMMQLLAPLAAEQGFKPVNCICAGDMPASRPSLVGLSQTMVDLEMWPILGKITTMLSMGQRQPLWRDVAV